MGTGDIVSVSSSDGSGFCECERCRALDVPGLLSSTAKRRSLATASSPMPRRSRGTRANGIRRKAAAYMPTSLQQAAGAPQNAGTEFVSVLRLSKRRTARPGKPTRVAPVRCGLAGGPREGHGALGLGQYHDHRFNPVYFSQNGGSPRGSPGEKIVCLPVPGCAALSEPANPLSQILSGS